jgi:two-component sensor histidine kinase
MVTRLMSNSWSQGVLFFGFWTLLGLAFAAQLYLSRSGIGSPVSWEFAVGRALADWYVYGLLSLPALWLAKQFHIERAHWQRTVLVHLAASAVFSVLWMVLRSLIEGWQSRGEPGSMSFADAFSHALFATFFFNLLIYWAIISVAHTLAYYRKYAERELRTAELESSLTQARLQALQMQLNPHFLFNTLNSISSLMHQDVEAADRMIARLSELLRYALESTNSQEVPLHEELHFLDRYLEIQQRRFGDRLTVQREIQPDTLTGMVPTLVLQPLVENSIRHGIAPRARPGRILLRARRNGETLLLEVADNGVGLQGKVEIDEGVGLSNTRARLVQLYGEAHRFEFSEGSDGGLVVTLEIPWREKPAAQSSTGVPPE